MRKNTFDIPQEEMDRFHKAMDAERTEQDETVIFCGFTSTPKKKMKAKILFQMKMYFLQEIKLSTSI